MRSKSNGRIYDYVVVDVNTQLDFCTNDATSSVANVETLIPSLRRAVAWIKRNAVPVVASIESHRPGELSDSGHPLCCIDGTSGQRKLDFTLLPSHTRIEVDNTLCCPINMFSRFQQVIFRKRSDDLLANPKADRFFTQIPTREFIVIGTGIENAIKSLTLGLLARSRNVSIVSDACGYWSKATAELALRRMVAKGARLMTVSQLLERKALRRHRYPHRSPDVEERNGCMSGGNNGKLKNPARSRSPRSRLPEAGRPDRISGPYRSVRKELR